MSRRSLRLRSTRSHLASPPCIANALAQSSAVPSEVWVLLPAILLWFALGYLLHAFGFAAAGAMVARQEEVQSVSAPFTVFLIGGYLLTYASIASPDASWVRIVSYRPPLMPVMMPARIALGHLAVGRCHWRS